MFCVRNFVDLKLSLKDISTSSIVSSMSEILSSISYILLVKLASIVFVHILRFLASLHSIQSSPTISPVPHIHTTSFSLQKRSGLLRISDEHGMKCYNKIKHKLSHQS